MFGHEKRRAQYQAGRDREKGSQDTRLLPGQVLLRARIIESEILPLDEIATHQPLSDTSKEGSPVRRQGAQSHHLSGRVVGRYPNAS